MLWMAALLLIVLPASAWMDRQHRIHNRRMAELRYRRRRLAKKAPTPPATANLGGALSEPKLDDEAEAASQP